MNNLYFDNVAQVGKLYIDYIFYEFESEPILFTCIDEEKKTYFCLCADVRFGQRWLITKCSLVTLKELIEEEFDIASLFLASPSIIAVDMDLQGYESSYVIERDKIDRLDLPKEGTYIRCDKESARNYLWNKEREVKHEQLKSAMGKKYSYDFDIIVNSYCSIIIETMNIGINQINMYSDSSGKEFVKRISKWRKSLQELMTHEYRIHTEEKYVDFIDCFDTDSAENDDYIQAA